MSPTTEPALPGRHDKNFVRRAEEIAAFRSVHGRFPRVRADNTAERLLGRWLSGVRTTHRGLIGKGPALTPERVRILDRVIPGWSQVTPGHVPNDALFHERLEKVAAFVAAHGRRPSSISDECEGLGRWLARVKSAWRGKGFMAWTPERARAVNEALPGWLDDDRK